METHLDASRLYIATVTIKRYGDRIRLVIRIKIGDWLTW